MGLVTGDYDAKEGGFAPGGASLHNCMSGHGPDQASYDKAVVGEPQAAQDRQHPGLHVRDAVSPSAPRNGRKPPRRCSSTTTTSGPASPRATSANQGPPMRILIAALALMAAACSPMADTGRRTPAAPAQSAEAACAAQHGTLPARRPRCNRSSASSPMPTPASAAPTATSARATAWLRRPAPPPPVRPRRRPVRRPTSEPLRLRHPVEDGKADATLCID